MLLKYFIYQYYPTSFWYLHWSLKTIVRILADSSTNSSCALHFLLLYLYREFILEAELYPRPGSSIKIIIIGPFNQINYHHIGVIRSLGTCKSYGMGESMILRWFGTISTAIWDISGGITTITGLWHHLLFICLIWYLMLSSLLWLPLIDKANFRVYLQSFQNQTQMSWMFFYE